MLLSVFMTITSVGWLQAADTSGDGYTKTDDGNYTVTTAKGLQNVLGKLKDGVPVTPTITLANDLDITGINFGGPANALWQGIFYLNVDSSQIKSLTIDGAGHSIIGKNTSNTEGGSFDPTKNYVFYFDGSGSSPITFKDLTVKNTNILAFNLYNLNNLVFNKVALNGNAEGGLHLNSSQLTATDFTTSGNGKFAVKLSRQVGNMPKFTLVSGTISEDNVPQIAFYDRHAYSEWSSNPTTSVADIIASVVTPGNDKWYRSLQLATMHTSNNGALAYVWTKSNDAVTVNTAGQLDSTINLGFATVNKVNLAATTYELGKQLVINRPLVISGPVDGEKAILTANANATWPTKENKPNEIVSSTANLISIEATGSGEVSISNLTVKNSKASGINVQPAEGITTSLKNIYLENNAHAGLLVHGIAKAEGLHTIGNVWGGVNVDKKQSYSPKFTFTADCSFDEPSQIWAEKENVASSNVVTLPSSGDWRMFEGKGGANNAVDMYYWTNASLNKEVKDANELVAAINTAQPGQVITLTGKDYGDENAIQSFGTVKAAGVTIKAADATKKPKVYGTIKILAENCTIDGLDMYTKSDGSTALKNIIDVVAMSATITNNVFNMGTPTTGNVSNGLCIWPYGTAEKASYVVKGNTFNGFKATVTGWSSTAFSIVENIDLSRFELSADQKSKVITIANEKELWTGNTFVDCYSDYIHSNFGGTDNSPLYTFAAISSNTDASSDADASSNTDALETAIHYSGDNAQVYAKGS